MFIDQEKEKDKKHQPKSDNAKLNALAMMDDDGRE